MLTMNDIRTYQRGQKANAEDLANRKINELVGQEEQQANAMQQQAQQQTNRSLEEDANTVLQELQKAKDPQGEFEKLPPILQKKVMELMNGGQQSAQPEQATNNEYSRGTPDTDSEVTETTPDNEKTEAPMDDGDGDDDSAPNTPPEATEQYSR